MNPCTKCLSYFNEKFQNLLVKIFKSKDECFRVVHTLVRKVRKINGASKSLSMSINVLQDFINELLIKDSKRGILPFNNNQDDI